MFKAAEVGLTCPVLLKTLVASIRDRHLLFQHVTHFIMINLTRCDAWILSMDVLVLLVQHLHDSSLTACSF